MNNLIQSGRVKMKTQEKETAEINEQTRLRFRRLRLLLLQMLESFGSRKIKACFQDTAVAIEIGEKKWNITPQRQFEVIETGYRVKNGFEISEASRFDFTEPENIEENKIFLTEHDVATYLTTEIAKKIAYDQRRNNKQAQH